MEAFPNPNRYETMTYRRCGKSGLLLPAISLGLWYNFGEVDRFDNCRALVRRAFDLGITHFDLANNYGPPPGSAEERVGRILREDFAGYRDELIISTKAGYRMWPGPYGEWGSRKYLLASLDASLKRLGLDYVDIFYSHRPDPNTPLEETLGALDSAVRQGKAIYVGISSYSGAMTADVVRICQANGFVRPIIHQPSYAMLNRWIETDLLPVTDRLGIGTIAFCPLAQGLLTGKYFGSARPSIDDVRGEKSPEWMHYFVNGLPSPEYLRKIEAVGEILRSGGRTLAQGALAWLWARSPKTVPIPGFRTVAQAEENSAAMAFGPLTQEQFQEVERILGRA